MNCVIFCGAVFGKGVLDAASFKDSAVALAAAASNTSEPPFGSGIGGDVKTLRTVSGALDAK